MYISDSMKNHVGIVRTYSYEWRPGMYKEIQTSVKTCNIFQIHHTLPEKVPIHPWESTTSPGERTDIDLAGTFFRKDVFDYLRLFFKVSGLKLPQWEI